MQLSGGQRERIGGARTLYYYAGVFALDEAPVPWMALPKHRPCTLSTTSPARRPSS